MSDNKIDSLTLDDGRKAERHITYDADGREIIEIFAEEKKPLKLEKRVIKEMKQVVAKETHETIRDGEVIFQEVKSLEPDIPLELRQRIAVVDHDRVVNGEYLTKEQAAEMVQEGVVAAVSTLLQNIEPVQLHSQSAKAVVKPLKAQQLVEDNVEETKKKQGTLEIVMGIVLVAQVVAIVAYMYFT